MIISEFNFVKKLQLKLIRLFWCITKGKPYTKSYLATPSEDYVYLSLILILKAHLIVPSPWPCPSPSKFIIVSMVMECLMRTLGSELILSVKERSRVTKLSQIFYLKYPPVFRFSIVSMVTGWITGRMGSSPIIDRITGRYFQLKNHAKFRYVWTVLQCKIKILW